MISKLFIKLLINIMAYSMSLIKHVKKMLIITVWLGGK